MGKYVLYRGVSHCKAVTLRWTRAPTSAMRAAGVLAAVSTKGCCPRLRAAAALHAGKSEAATALRTSATPSVKAGGQIQQKKNRMSHPLSATSESCAMLLSKNTILAFYLEVERY